MKIWIVFALIIMASLQPGASRPGSGGRRPSPTSSVYGSTSIGAARYEGLGDFLWCVVGKPQLYFFHRT